MKPNRKNNPSGSTLLLTYRPYLILLGITLLIYSSSLNNEFTNWDDQGYVYENPLVTGFTWNKIPEIFSTLNIAGNYHPLTILSLGINHLFGGLNPWSYILTNLLLHALCASFIFHLTTRLFSIEAAWPAAILFVLHPLHVESVAWVSERKDVLYTTFWLAAWIKWLDYRKSASYLDLIISLALFILSNLSKGMAITLTGVILLTDYFKEGVNSILNRKYLISILPFILISILFGYIAIKAQAAQGTIIEKSGYSIPENIILVIYGFQFYLTRFIAPWGLCAFYPYPFKPGEIIPVFVWASLGGTLVIISAVVFLRKHLNGWITWAFLFYAGCISIVVQILPVGSALTADRYFYVSSIGWCIGLGYAFTHLQKSIQPYVLGIIGSILAILTFRQADTWSSSIELFENVIACEPTAAVAYNNIGTILGIEKKDRTALSYYQKAIYYNPKYSEAWNNMGILYKDLGNSDSAIICAEKALEIYSGYVNAYSNLGNIYFSQKKYDEAATQFYQVIQKSPKDPSGYLNFGAAMQMKGDYVGAEKAYLEVIKLLPNDIRPLHNLGDVKFSQKDYAAAIQYYQRILQLIPGDADALQKIKTAQDTRDGKIKDALTTYLEQISQNPENADAYLNAGTEYFRQGKYPDAIQYFEKSLALNPNKPEAWNNLGTAYAVSGKGPKAKNAFEKSASLRSDYSEPQYNLGLYWSQQNNQNKALEHYQKAARLGHEGAQQLLKQNGFSW